MIRAESPARNARPAQYCRANWAPMLNPRTLRSVPGIWGRSLTSIPRAGRPGYEPSQRRPALVRLVVFDRLALGIVAGAEDPLLSLVFITRLKIGYMLAQISNSFITWASQLACCRTQGHIFLYDGTAANCQRLRFLSDIANSHLPASLIPLKLNTFFPSSEDSKRNVPLSNT
jgi:hypothetical protein